MVEALQPPIGRPDTHTPVLAADFLREHPDTRHPGTRHPAPSHADFLREHPDTPTPRHPGTQAPN